MVLGSKRHDTCAMSVDAPLPCEQAPAARDDEEDRGSLRRFKAAIHKVVAATPSVNDVPRNTTPESLAADILVPPDEEHSSPRETLQYLANALLMPVVCSVCEVLLLYAVAFYCEFFLARPSRLPHTRSSPPSV